MRLCCRANVRQCLAGQSVRCNSGRGIFLAARESRDWPRGSFRRPKKAGERELGHTLTRLHHRTSPPTLGPKTFCRVCPCSHVFDSELCPAHSYNMILTVSPFVPSLHALRCVCSC